MNFLFEEGLLNAARTYEVVEGVENLALATVNASTCESASL
jgi:hypothetical protein